MNYTIAINPAFNSLEIAFDGKPAEAVRDALKALRFRWHAARRVWYGYTDEATARAAIDNAGTEAAPAQAVKAAAPAIDKDELRRQFSKAWNSQSMIDYCVKNTAAVAKLPTGELLTIERQSIETSFCFGESGYDYDDAQKMAQHARTSEDYFKRENMQYFARFLQNIDDAAEFNRVALVIYTDGKYSGQSSDCALRNFGFARISEVIDACGGSCKLDELPGRELIISCLSCRVATAEEIAIIREAVQTAAKAHEKRVDAYLKRYGTSKVHSWTYWRDA